jgi:hypothetical protein
MEPRFANGPVLMAGGIILVNRVPGPARRRRARGLDWVWDAFKLSAGSGLTRSIPAAETRCDRVRNFVQRPSHGLSPGPAAAGVSVIIESEDRLNLI